MESADSGDDRATHELRAAFDRQIVGEEEASRTQFHYIIKALGNREDDHAAAALAGNRGLATSTRNCPESTSGR
jgi:hypothetical protein